MPHEQERVAREHGHPRFTAPEKTVPESMRYRRYRTLRNGQVRGECSWAQQCAVSVRSAQALVCWSVQHLYLMYCAQSFLN